MAEQMNRTLEVLNLKAYNGINFTPRPSIVTVVDFGHQEREPQRSQEDIPYHF
jgi:hypothetical protein